MTWTTKADSLVKVVHPTLVAERLGVSIEVVLARRAELKLPSVEVQFARGPWHGGGQPAMSQAQAELIRTNPPDVAAKLLGLSLRTIYNRRERLGVAKRTKGRKRGRSQ